MSLSEWAEEKRILDPLNSAEPGKWKNRRTPYLVGPMDACTDRAVEYVIGMMPVQVGKTEILLNFLGYVVDQDPGPGLLVYPTELDTKKIITHRIQPMFKANPSLSRHVHRSDDLGLTEMRFDRCTIFPAWSNSPSTMASTPCRYVWNDEVDKFPPFAGKEASPIKLSEMRTTTFRGRRKILVFSTPRTDLHFIWNEWQRSNQHLYWCPCTRCGHYQVFDFFKGLKWPEGSTSDGIKESQGAWYECESCERHILNAEKFEMTARGVWLPKGVTITRTGALEGSGTSRRRSGFHMNAIPSPWLTFSDLASEFLDSVGDAGRKMNFWNSRLALPWQNKAETVKAAHLKKRVKDYRSGTAPAGALRLTAGVDVQEDHFWYVVRAWGEGERSWLVRYGSCTSWKDVERVILAPYKCGAQVLRVERALVDSGYDNDAVYKFARKHRPIVDASKGFGGSRLQPCKLAHPRPGVRRWDFNADFWKDKLARFIQVEDDEPGAWCLPKDLPADYFAQMTSESRVFTRKYGRTFSSWQPVTDRAPNHGWDCETLNVVAADIIGVRYAEAEEAAAAAPPPPPRAPGKEPWLEGGKQWLGDTGSIWDQ